MKEKQKTIIEKYIAAYNSFDVNGMTQYVHQDICFKNIANGQLNLTLEGIEKFEVQANAVKAYFKDRKQTITAWTFDEDKVIIDIDYFAIVAQEFPNGWKVGDTIELKGQSEFTFKEGRIIQIVDRS